MPGPARRRKCESERRITDTRLIVDVREIDWQLWMSVWLIAATLAHPVPPKHCDAVPDEKWKSEWPQPHDHEQRPTVVHIDRVYPIEPEADSESDHRVQQPPVHRSLNAIHVRSARTHDAGWSADATRHNHRTTRTDRQLCASCSWC
jgi:hypothetical protein